MLFLIILPYVFCVFSFVQEEPATSQLYVLCDMALAMIRALAQRMGLDQGLLTAKHPGGVTLPASFYRPLDKEERGEHSWHAAGMQGASETMLLFGAIQHAAAHGAVVFHHMPCQPVAVRFHCPPPLPLLCKWATALQLMLTAAQHQAYTTLRCLAANVFSLCCNMCYICYIVNQVPLV
jgi:hypothetical protein